MEAAAADQTPGYWPNWRKLCGDARVLKQAKLMSARYPHLRSAYRATFL